MLDFLYTAVSWVLLRWHQLFAFLGLPASSGANWALSIVFLVITARLLLFRLFIKQVKYQRHMQQMQPKLQAVREKYKGDRAEMQRQMMKLQQEQGFNPLAGCLPMFLQFPIFIALYHVLRHIANTGNNPHPSHRLLTLYSFTETQTRDAAAAKLFGHAPLAGRLMDSADQLTTLGGERGVTSIVIVVLVIISAGATYMTQRLARQGMATQPEGTAATVQRLMLYAIPVFTLGSGLFFPLGVLLYWFTSNSWTMFQQLYINRFHPHTAKDEPEVGVVGRSLAPRPGQRPVRPDRGRAAGTAAGDSASGRPTRSKDIGQRGTPKRVDGATSGSANAADGVDPDDPGADGDPPLRSSTPRPGQRPARPNGGGKRPPGKKKRR